MTGHTRREVGQVQPAGRRGIVVLAYGSARYQRQAANLARSLARNSPAVPRTLVTDRAGSPAARLYDTVLTIEGNAGTDCRQKLYLDGYTPYQHTLYIDADSLVLRDLRPVLELFINDDFAVIGKNITDGRWYGDVQTMRRLAGSASLPKFNAGLLYFTQSPRTRRIFALARDLIASYDELGLAPFRGGVADEPLLAMALAHEGVPAHPFTGQIMASLLGVTSPVHLDVLAGRCGFHKEGQPVSPRIVHFAADYSSPYRLAGAFYRRETLRLRLADRLRSPAAAGLAAHTMHGLPCVLANTIIRATGDGPGERRPNPVIQTRPTGPPSALRAQPDTDRPSLSRSAGQPPSD